MSFYDTATGQCQRTLGGYSHPVTDLAFSPDGQLLAATGGNDQMIRLWDVARQQLLRTIEGDELLAAVAFSPDGQTMAWGGNGPLYQVQLYHLAAHRHLETLPARFNGGVYKIVYSPDGQLMAVPDWNGRGQVWQVATLERLFNQPGPLVAEKAGLAQHGRCQATRLTRIQNCQTLCRELLFVSSQVKNGQPAPTDARHQTQRLSLTQLGKYRCCCCRRLAQHQLDQTPLLSRTWTAFSVRASSGRFPSQYWPKAN